MKVVKQIFWYAILRWNPQIMPKLNLLYWIYWKLEFPKFVIKTVNTLSLKSNPFWFFKRLKKKKKICPTTSQIEPHWLKHNILFRMILFFFFFWWENFPNDTSDKTNAKLSNKHLLYVAKPRWLIPYRYMYRYRNVNVSYRFKYRVYQPCTGHTSRFRVYRSVRLVHSKKSI